MMSVPDITEHDKRRHKKTVTCGKRAQTALEQYKLISEPDIAEESRGDKREDVTRSTGLEVGRGGGATIVAGASGTAASW